MTTAENLKTFFCQMVGRLYVPPYLLNTNEKKVLHLSDTPTSLYPAINDLITSLKPDAIIHTGDLADDIKLEYNPNNLESYARAVKPFLEMMERCTAEQIFIVPGNHDNVQFLSQIVNKSKLIKEGEFIDIGRRTFGLAHKIKRLPHLLQSTHFNLYGHNFKLPKENCSNTVYLNGIQNINVILLPSNNVIKIPYPWNTNHYRKMNNVIIPKTI